MKRLYFVSESLAGVEDLCWCRGALSTAKKHALEECAYGNSVLRIYDATEESKEMQLVCTYRDGKWRAA